MYQLFLSFSTLIPSCYTISANEEFRRFDSYGTITEVHSIEGEWSAGKGDPAYEFLNNALVIRGSFDIPPTELKKDGQKLTKPITGSFELGINEIGDDLLDNKGTKKVCFKRIY